MFMEREGRDEPEICQTIYTLQREAKYVQNIHLQEIPAFQSSAYREE
jgi:hypothetical protein